MSIDTTSHRVLELTAEETLCLTEGGYVMRTVNNRVWRIAHESYYPPRQWPDGDRHVSLSAAEVDVIARMPEGLTVGGTTIRSEATA